jgi:hypothetical protein
MTLPPHVFLEQNEDLRRGISRGTERERWRRVRERRSVREGV